MIDQLQQLLALAEVDKAIRTVDGRLADLAAEEARLRDRLAQEEEAFRERQEAHRRLRHEALTKSTEVDATDAKIRGYQKKLDHEIIPYKEMEYLREQVALLRARLDGLAEEALRLMEEAEQDGERLREDEARHRERVGRIQDDLAAVGRQRDGLLKQKDDLNAKREVLAAEVPPHLHQHYERLRGSVSSPVVPVDGGTCGGCHLRLADTTLERVREGREVVTCENCSRFLYWQWR